MTPWRCGCGATGTSEAAVRRHVDGEGCQLFGLPGTNDHVAGTVSRRYVLTAKGDRAVLAIREGDDA